MRKHWKRWTVGLVVGLAVLLVGGPYVYIHFIEGDPPAELSLTADDPSASPTATSTSASSAAAGKYTVASGSQVGYRVEETLFGQSTTAVGRTSDVTGSATVDGVTVSAAEFTAQTSTLSSDQGGRDNQVRGRILETDTFPTGGFRLTKPITLSSAADGVTATGSATGDLTLHGVTKSVTFEVKAKRSGSTIEVNGSIPIHFSDYEIDNPSGGPATTGDDGTLEFLLKLTSA